MHDLEPEDQNWDGFTSSQITHNISHNRTLF